MDIYAGDYAPAATQRIKIRTFHGIDMSMDENDLPVQPECWCKAMANAWIQGGNITVRNNFVKVYANSIDEQIPGGYTHTVHSLGMFTAAKRLVAGVDAWKDGVHHHYGLVYRDIADSGVWLPAKNASLHNLGGAQSDTIYFANADFSFANYSGDFWDLGYEFDACIIANGADVPMFLTAEGGLGVLGAAGWLDATVDNAANTVTSMLSVSDGDTVQLCSRTQNVPGNVEAYKTYYVIQTQGSRPWTFKLGDVSGGGVHDITANGSEVAVRLARDLGAWTDCVIDPSENTVAAPTLAKEGYRIQFSAPNGSLPKGISANTWYYIIDINAEVTKFSISAVVNGSALAFSGPGGNVLGRIMKDSPSDAPRGNNIFVHADRLWLNVGNTVYHNAGVIDGKGKPNDWSTALITGNFPLLSWDGDTVKTAREFNGKPWLAKRNSVYMVSGNAPPFSIQPVFTATGTIAPNSVCYHMAAGLFYATAEGIQVFDGASTRPYLTQEIQGIWSADNADAIATVRGDMLFVYGNLIDPTDTDGFIVKGILVVDINTKNICYWTTDADSSGDPVAFDSVLDPRYTVLKDGITKPEIWFANGADIYKYDETPPAEDSAVQMMYWMPASDYGTSMRKKNFNKIKVTGDGGDILAAAMCDGVPGTMYNIALPAAKAKKIKAKGYKVGFVIASNGDPVTIKDVELEYTEGVT